MATFVAKDYEILEGRYRMRRWCYRGSLHGLPDRIVIWLFVLTSDFNVSWFGYHQAYWAVKFSKALGKKSLVILGGFDVCEEEDANLPSRVDEIRYILRNAHRILAVSKRVREKALGIEPSARVDVVYHGFDAGKYRPSGEKKEVATTVAFVNRQNLRRKGLETFVRSAVFAPECEFLVVGEWLDDAIDHLRSIATKNVSFPGHVSETELIRILQGSSAYVQISAHEGFGCSLAEAMLCGCVPVVTNRGAIPEVAGDAGIYVEYDNPEGTARAIRAALTRGEPGGRAARERIASHFPLEKRREALLAAVAEAVP
jgi:glycosyltransferase involved in cell wall biosynthesis